jgi:hypothetical protein
MCQLSECVPRHHACPPQFQRRQESCATKIRGGLLATTMMLGLASLIPSQAHADLIGTGKTVQAFYYNGVFK